MYIYKVSHFLWGEDKAHYYTNEEIAIAVLNDYKRYFKDIAPTGFTIQKIEVEE